MAKVRCCGGKVLLLNLLEGAQQDVAFLAVPFLRGRNLRACTQTQTHTHRNTNTETQTPRHTRHTHTDMYTIHTRTHTKITHMYAYEKFPAYARKYCSGRSLEPRGHYIIGSTIILYLQKVRLAQAYNAETKATCWASYISELLADDSKRTLNN